jgi:SAM-dependent methyltransferase
MIIKFIIVLILILLGIFILTILGIYIWSEIKHYLYNQAPTVGTYSSHYDLMKKKLKWVDGWSLVDLGCGDGKLLRFMKNQYNFSCVDGIDNNLMVVYRWRFLNFLFNKKNIHLYYGDIQQIDISKYDYIYLFLLPKHLDNIQNRLQDNMKSNAIIVCNTFEFSKWEPYQIIRSDDSKSVIRLYKK